MEHRLADIVVPRYDLTGKVAVITGGTKGLGYGIAVTFASYGADVVVGARTVSDCERVEKELQSLGVRALGIPTDVRIESQVNNLVKTAVEKLGKVDIMVCAAGGANTVMAVDMTEEQWDEILDTDLKGVFFGARAAAREMIKQGTGGKIINIASAAALGGSKGISNYCAAKAGVVNLTKALAEEWGKYNICVNSICPGYIPTSINEDTLIHNPKKAEGIKLHAMIRRYGKIEEVAAPALLLASEYSGYTTGSCVVIDGGGSSH